MSGNPNLKNTANRQRGFNERRWLGLIIGLYFLFAFGDSLLFPMWEAPDENAHYLYALYIARENKQPTIEHNYEALQPQGYYWLASLPLRIMDRINPSLVNFYQPDVLKADPNRKFDWQPENYRLTWGALVLRWINVGLGGLTLYFVYRGIKTLAPQETAVRLGAAALIGLTPQFLHVNASVSNDGPAYLVGAVLYWGMALVLTRDLKSAQLGILGAAAVFLPFLIKLNAIPAGLTLLAAIIFISWKRIRTAGPPGHRTNLSNPFSRIAWILTPIVLLAGVFILFSSSSPSVSRLWWEVIWRTFPYDPDFQRSLIRFTLLPRSFWALLGWAKVGPPLSTGLALSGLAGLGILLSVPYLLPERVFTRFSLFGKFRRFSNLRIEDRAVWAFNFLAVVLITLAVAKNFTTSTNIQGRFFYPSFSSIAFLIVAGWRAAIRPGKAKWLPTALTIGLTAFNIFIWLAYVIPAFFQPFLDG